MSENYKFTQDQLFLILDGCIEMFLEYQGKHGQDPERAKISTCFEIIEGIDAEKDQRIGEIQGEQEREPNRSAEINDFILRARASEEMGCTCDACLNIIRKEIEDEAKL